jgi:hypothetical protein
MIHLVRIDEVSFIKNSKVVWKNSNLKNILHFQGEELILKILFSDYEDVPEYYYFGLDNRETISVDDTLPDLVSEPVVHNYMRQVKNSIDDWTFAVANGYNVVKSSIITFGASGGSWGPVRNLFLTNINQSQVPGSGYLISTVNLGQSITVSSGDAISLRMSIGLRNCP